MAQSYVEADFLKELANFPEQRSLSPNTGSAASLDIICGWLKACDSDHRECGCSRTVPSSCPARLIDINKSPGRFCVVPSTTVPAGDRYITLSYRWPEREVDKLGWLQLTVDNEKDLEEGLPISDLPRIFQDAIRVARHIGIYLLWIDCLCIVQEGDDSQDWDAESARTNETYQNAYCNLSASDASVENGEGLFFEREPRFYERLTIKKSLGGTVTEGDWTSTIKDMWRTEVNNSQLSHRGWVFPERVLSSRIIHFCRHEIFWECREASLCESFPAAVPWSSFFDLGDIVPLRQRPSTLWPGSDWFGDPNFPMNDVPYEVWDDAIKNYTRCQFTKPQDKLVAISGVARYFRDYIEDIYLAGMWRKRLAAELGWWIYPGRSRYALGEEPPYYAPSFSWASVKGQINSSGPFALGILVDVESVTMGSGPRSQGGDEIFCENVFGAPLQAPVFQLRVSGVLRPGKLRWADNWELDVTASSLKDAENENTAVVLTPFFDFEVPLECRAEFESETIYMMYWRYGPEPGEYDMSKSDLYCMLLMPTDRARHQFRRAGFVFAQGNEGRLLHESRVEDVLPECLNKETGRHTVYLV